MELDHGLRGGEETIRERRWGWIWDGAKGVIRKKKSEYKKVYYWRKQNVCEGGME